MFGHDHKDEDKKDEDLTVQPMPAPANNGLLGIDDDDDADQNSANPGVTPSAPPVEDNAPLTASVPAFDTSDNAIPQDSATSPSDIPAPAVDDDLLNIKKEALEELSPLIDHLEQSSEEKFRTTMMMIQASDNKALIPQAFTAAKEISDDKKRAQALLDIVNEINYFTHQKPE